MGPPPSSELRDADLSLASRAARRDRQAQRELVTRLLGRVRRTVASLLRDDGDAEDAMQQAVIEILHAVGGYRGDAPLEAWAGRIAARTALRIARARRVRDAVVDRDVDAAETPGPGLADLEGGAEAALAYLEGLSEERRVCLVLRHVLGYSVDEIADLSGASPNTVKDRLLHGRAEVRRLVRQRESTRLLPLQRHKGRRPR